MDYVMKKPRTKWEQRKERIVHTWNVFKERKIGIIGIGILIIFVTMAFASFVPPLIDEMYLPLSGSDPDIIGMTPPSLQHPLGTDFGGRDVFSQLLEGCRWALIIGVEMQNSGPFMSMSQ